MDISVLAKRVGITNAKVLARAKELLRQTSNQPALKVGQLGLCLPAACLYISCRQTGESVDKARLAKCSGCQLKVLVRTVTVVETASKTTQRSLSISQLAVQFGLTELTEFARAMFEKYKVKLCESLPAQRRKDIQLDRPIIAAALFYLCCVKEQQRVDRKKILEISNATSVELTRLCDEIKKLVPDLNNEKQTKKRKIGDSVLRTENKENPPTSIPSEISTKGELTTEQEHKPAQEEVPRALPKKLATESAAYREWKQNLMQSSMSGGEALKSLQISRAKARDKLLELDDL